MKKEYTKYSLELMEDRIVVADFYNGNAMNIHDAKHCYDEIEKIANGKKLGVMCLFNKETPANEEIMEYMNASDRPKQLLFASAFVIESLSFRLTIMLFMKFYNVFSFRKTFNDKQSALQWLREMRSKQE